MNFIILSSGFGLIVATAALWAGNSYFMYFAIGLFGFTLIPIVGTGYTFTAINFLPISPAASCGIVHIANAGLSFGLASLAAYFVDEDGWSSILLMAIICIFAIGTGLLMKEHPKIKMLKKD